MSTDNIGKLNINVFDSRTQMGEAAARDIADRMKELLKAKAELRMIFAAAPSQNEMLKSLLGYGNLDWSRVVAFHMDEYIGLPEGAGQAFSSFLEERLFRHLPFKEVNLIDGNNPQNECARYGKRLREAPVDIICMGIGENGHIAFNDPPVADFDDREVMKKVKLDEVCRQQQVNDGCFSSIDQVPAYAYTLTIPTLMSAAHIFCVVPGNSKREAVHQTIHAPEISTSWPSTILRKHDSCIFYFDRDSYGKK